MADTPKLVLPELSVSQSQKETTVNESLRILDALVQPNVIDKDLTAPPGSPTDGASYIVAAGATGAWAGHDGDIAYYSATSWIFAVPAEGWIAYVQDENALYVYTGTSGAEWSVLTLVSGSNSYDVGGTYVGKPAVSQVILRVPMVRAVDFPDDFSGSQGRAGTASTGTATFSIQKNGSGVGSMVFTASATATFSTTGGGVSFAAGDVLTVVAPGSQDATLSDLGYLFKGSKA